MSSRAHARPFVDTSARHELLHNTLVLTHARTTHTCARTHFITLLLLPVAAMRRIETDEVRDSGLHGGRQG